MKFRLNKCSTASQSKVMAKSMFSKRYISTGYCMFIKNYFTHVMYGKVDISFDMFQDYSLHIWVWDFSYILAVRIE